LVRPPPLAVIVRLYVPAVVPVAALSVSALLPVPGEAMLAGENVPVTPAGRPLTESATAERNPFKADEEKVALPVLPTTTLTEVAL